MKHLQDLYSGDWMKTFAVGYLPELKHCSGKHQDNCNYNSFVNFPSQHGVQIKDDYTIDGSEAPGACCDNMSRRGFLQEWLFFQLISCVVQDGGRPILPRKDLTCHLERQLSTGSLNEALAKWHDSLVRSHDEEPEANTMRLLEANQILELAKQVIIANLAHKPPRLPVPLDEEVELGPDDDDEEEEEEEDEDQRALCYMVLGETLSAVLVHAMKKCNVELPGWEPDDGGGWGPPAYVYKKMQEEGWCPRSQATIKGQLGRNATLLYVTARAHETNRHNIHGKNSSPEKCTSRDCGFIEAEHGDPDARPKYKPSHSPHCKNRRKCKMVGPDEKDVLDILEKSEGQREGSFPLLRLVDEGGKTRVEVERGTKGTPFATISHVWSQGLGNRNERKIHECQLKMIGSWVKKAFGDQDDKDHLFWIDTFAIPQNKGDPRRAKLKRRAIGLIHHIFSNAQHCIIIDRHLLDNTKSIHDCRTIGATLLACGWMMRLWTLQEARVSPRLHLAMRDNGGLRSYNDLWNDGGEKGGVKEDVVFLSMAGMVQRKVDQNLMIHRRDRDPMRFEQEAQQQPKTHDHRHAHGALLIASTWRATRYRTTRNLEEETLALATLLGVPISQEPGNPDSKAPNGATTITELGQNQKRGELMRGFWESIRNADKFRNSIPGGMIFLPGKRLPFPGFGWAPLTWMSGEDEAYPYPLDHPGHPTTLKEGKGLLVQYPGFLLYPAKQKLSKIIRVSRRKPFEFAVNRRLDEWYRVRAANEKIQQDGESPGVEDDAEEDTLSTAQDLLSRIGNEEAVKIALILSRPRPVEVTGEIGLLVELCHEDIRGFGSQPLPREQRLLCCKIIRRVEVSRLSASRAESCISRFEKFEREGIAGVQLPDLQEWCVDGYPDLQMPKSSVTTPKRVETAPSPKHSTGVVQKTKQALTRTLTWFGR